MVGILNGAPDRTAQLLSVLQSGGGNSLMDVGRASLRAAATGTSFGEQHDRIRQGNIDRAAATYQVLAAEDERKLKRDQLVFEQMLAQREAGDKLSAAAFDFAESAGVPEENMAQVMGELYEYVEANDINDVGALPGAISTVMTNLGIQPRSDFQERIAAASAGRSVTNVNLPAGESQFVEELGKLDAQRLGEIASTGRSAQQTLQVVDQLGQVLENTATGALEPGKAALGNLARSLGVDPNSIGLGNVSNAQQLQALANELVLNQAARMAGVLSDSDIALLRSTTVQLGADPVANARILADTRQRLQGDVAYATQAEEYARANNGLGGFVYSPPTFALSPQSNAPAAPPPASNPNRDPRLDTPGMSGPPLATAVGPNGEEIYFRNGRWEDERGNPL